MRKLAEGVENATLSGEQRVNIRSLLRKIKGEIEIDYRLRDIRERIVLVIMSITSIVGILVIIYLEEIGDEFFKSVFTIGLILGIVIFAFSLNKMAKRVMKSNSWWVKKIFLPKNVE